MKRILIQDCEELEKIPVKAGDMVFVKYDKAHKPVIKVFQRVVPV